MNVLSLCDGMSCGRIALQRAGVDVKNYYASEIKKSALTVSKANWPEIIQLGNLKNIHPTLDIPEHIDLFLAGTPCQDFSIARVSNGSKMDGLKGNKSSLFYDALYLKNELNPKYFLFENVRMDNKSKNQLDEYLGVEGVYINSNLFTFQNRLRCYWTNIPFDRKIIDKNMSFQTIKGIGNLDEAMPNRTPSREKMWNNGNGRTPLNRACVNITYADKVGCLLTKQDRAPNSGMISHKNFARYLSRREQELAQTVPLGYTDSVSYQQATNLLGDGWTVDVVAHIFRGLKA